MIEKALPLVPPFVVYPLLIFLFHRGEYPPLPASARGPGKQCVESGMILSVILAVRLLKALYPTVFTWTRYTFTYLLTGLSLLYVVKTLNGVDVKHIGFRLPTNRRVLTLFTGFLVLLLVGGIARNLLFNTPLPYLNRYFISGVVIGPFVEETVFRGLVQTRLEAAFGATRSWAVSGFLFGFYHLWAHYLVAGQALTFPGSIQLITITLFGMLLGVLFAKTRSLLPPFLLHAVNNFVATQTW